MRALLLFLVVLVACEPSRAARRYTREEVRQKLSRLETVGLEVGEFAIEGSSAVVDGDTIKVKGLDASLRLLAIDTEETFKHDEERRAYSAGWEEYKKKMRGNSPRPAKFATPLGEEAKKFAQQFFDGVDKVKLERDHPGEIRDFFGRYLSYVFVFKDGQWLNYNLEAVKAGMTPYFVKYGRSRRFHQSFVEAEKKAREAGLGIWAPGKQHYDDYDERLKWWHEREQAITRFEKEMADHPDSYIALTRFDALFRLEQKLGETVTLLGSVGEVRWGERGPTVVKLSRKKGQDFDVVFFDKDVAVASGLQFKQGEYVQVRGVVAKYSDKQGNKRLQLQVTLPGQVLAPSAPLEQMLKERPEEDAQQERDGD